MSKITIINNGKTVIAEAENGALLSDVLISAGIKTEHICGGRGTCGKCRVEVDGKNELSCQYFVSQDIVVRINDNGNISTILPEANPSADKSRVFAALDIGSTTIAAALCSCADGSVVASASVDNSQRKYGADVMSRILFCMQHGTVELQKEVMDSVNNLLEKLLAEADVLKIDTVYAAGNTTMLHLFLGVDCSSMGAAPYTPVFLSQKEIRASDIGLMNADNIILLPGIDAFMGADIVAGLVYAETPPEGKYNILLDLGTNAEAVVYGKNKVLCTSAAAGPCFEGANISHGMSAVKGAVYSFDENGSFGVIGNIKPSGICATGLIDIIAYLLNNGIVDSDGCMDDDFTLSKNVSLSPKDIRQYQLAKSAVFSALVILVKHMEITFDDIDKFYVAGGFSSAMNVKNAVLTGLFPEELESRFIPVNNSCLKGLIRYASEKSDIGSITERAEYIDLSLDPEFSDSFIENLEFAEV